MGRRRKEVIEALEVVDIAAKGKAVGKHNGIAVMVDKGVPGDVVKVLVTKKKKNLWEARNLALVSPSKMRVEPFCEHFEYCGGCKWQNLAYTDQLNFKAEQVANQLRRISGVDIPPIQPIRGSELTRGYRNKLEFTFSNNRWLTQAEINSEAVIEDRKGLGFHAPGRFDQVVDVQRCHLEPELHNEIRNFVKQQALIMDLEFYDQRQRVGDLRNLILRCNAAGEWMIILIIGNETSAAPSKKLLELCASKFPALVSGHLIINTKSNDTFFDQPMEHIFGEPHLTESFENEVTQKSIEYIIGPKSFFQTNTSQAEVLYNLVASIANLSGGELVYDLYSGTGSIALFLAAQAKHVIGIEYVEEAVADAHRNAQLNGIENAQFFAGDMSKVLDDEFIATHGHPEVVVTDPPRAGMHPDVVDTILSMAPNRIIYVSCDPATQARDIGKLGEAYKVTHVQPVDMFPHTAHVENIALLERIQ